ncbi:MAG: hypothetical protein JWQ40_3927 [Segetibacter sp.]|jgi:hypothetical protein|nr:hypothetical protein [Segetibacter sp.]
MKKFQKAALALVTASCLALYACGPNDDKNGMDPANSDGEGAIDSTRIPNFDSSHTSIVVPSIVKEANSFN